MWETDPVGGPPGQPAYLNAVVCADPGDLGPGDLLAAAHRVEAALGRKRWGPRTIDIDVLLYDDVISSDPTLTLPHPRMTERAFVVLPLLDIDPDPVLPDGRRILDVALGDQAARPVAPPLVLPRPAFSGGSGGAGGVRIRGGRCRPRGDRPRGAVRARGPRDRGRGRAGRDARTSRRVAPGGAGARVRGRGPARRAR